MPDSTSPVTANRSIRVFISSTFRDMIEERNALMTHTWPELRRFCRERQVELVEVDLRWGITEEQSSRKETLKVCLDEIRTGRPFFIGLLGERYGWVPGEDAFNADLRDEQPWLDRFRGRSVTELEILHGVLTNRDMAGRAYFYFRASAYAQGRGPDFRSEGPESAVRQIALKTLIRQTCTAKKISLRQDYPDPRQLAAFVLADLKAAIDARFPLSSNLDPIDREAGDHEAFGQTRRRTYIGRQDYFTALDHHAGGGGVPLAVLGDSGSGKSSLLANWLPHWQKAHPRDYIFQHYIGGTSDSADHWRLMSRLMAEIRRWTGETEELPRTHDDILKTFPVWLAKARLKAERTGIRFLVVLDALNQLEDRDHARLLGWLPPQKFTGPLRLVVSTLPGRAGADDPLQVIRSQQWPELHVRPLTVEERQRMITGYLARCGKRLDAPRVSRLANAPAAANPLYLKIVLDELRVTGTRSRLDQRLKEYLSAADIPALLKQVLARYERDYEVDRKGLVAEALGSIYAARRGLSETELLQLLRSAGQAQLPPAFWAPLRAALEDSLVDRGGILNFAHDFLRAAVESTFAADESRRVALRLQLADFFEAQPITARTCDELPWLLKESHSHTRLRTCLLNIDRFLQIGNRDGEELRRYWVEQLREERTMGTAYSESFERWSREAGVDEARIAIAANRLGAFLHAAALHADAEPFMRRALNIAERDLGMNHLDVFKDLGNLALLLQATNRLAAAEPLLRRALDIAERCLGPRHPEVAKALGNLAKLLLATNRLGEAESLLRRALEIDEYALGAEHPDVARGLNDLAQWFQAAGRFAEAEPFMRRALEIYERRFGKDHPEVARAANNLAGLFLYTSRLAEAEPLFRRALVIDERSFGKDHPSVALRLSNLAGLLAATDRRTEAEALLHRALVIEERSLGKDHPRVAITLNNLAQTLVACNRLADAEPLIRRAIEIDEQSLGRDHTEVASLLASLAELLHTTGRLDEAESLMRRALDIRERSFGRDHPEVAQSLNNLALLFRASHRVAEAEPLLRRTLEILLHSSAASEHDYSYFPVAIHNYAALLEEMGRGPQEVLAQVNAVGRPFGIRFEITDGRFTLFRERHH